MSEKKYTSGLISQSFWFIETKKVIELLNEGKTKAEIKEICIEQNLFGAAKEYRATRMFGYVWRRVNTMDKDLIQLFIDSDLQTQKLIVLMSILKTDRLYFEFVYEVYREKIILGASEIEDADLNVFFSNKESIDENIEKWKSTTKKHLKSNYTNFMTDANLLIDIDGKKKITPPILDIEFERYLKEKGEDAIIKAFTGVN